MFVSLLLLSCFSFSNHFANTALAAEKTDTVTGTITLSIESDQPVGPADPSNPGENPIVDPSGPASDEVPQTPDTIKDLLAKTGDVLPFAGLVLVLSAIAIAGVMIVSRRRATQTGVISDSVNNFSHIQKISAVVLAVLLVCGSAYAFNKAIADDSADIASTTADTSIATAIGKITVSDDGTIKSATINIKNNLKTELRVSKFSVDAGSDIADLVNDQITAGESLASGDALDKAWTPAPGTISAELLEKLNSANDKTLSFDLTVDVAYNTVKVEFAANDGTDTIFDTQEVAQGGNAVLPATDPERENYEFRAWKTANDGSGTEINAEYLAANAVSVDTKFFAKWSGPQVFLAAKSDDKSLPCKIFSGEDTSTSIKTIDEVKTAATTLKNGGANPDATVYNATSDAWHLFVKISGDGSQVNDWMECRIIQTGQHDTDGTGLTFQAIHALPNTVAYDTTYTDATGETPYTGNWSTCSLRKYLNGAFRGTLPSSLQSKINLTPKRTNSSAGELPNGGLVSETRDALWVLSCTEFVKDVTVKSPTYWNSSEHDGSTYLFWSNKDVVVGKRMEESSEQAQLLLALNSTRGGTLLPFKDNIGRAWQRSLSPFFAYGVVGFYSNGIVYDRSGFIPNNEICVNPVFAL